MNDETRRRIIEAIKTLDAQEQELLVRVLRIEREKLFLERPRVREELLRVVREVIR